MAATINVQDNEEMAILADDSELTLTEDEIGNFFQDTSSEEKLETKCLQVNLKALQEEPSSLQEPAYITQICRCN